MVDAHAYKASVIQTLPLLERLIFEYGAREGLVQIVNDIHEERQGKEQNPAPRAVAL